MSVPPEIRAVPRPSNTIVFAYGPNKNKYGVRERNGYYKSDSSSYPKNGKVIGHIVNGQFVPVPLSQNSGLENESVDYKSWGEYQFADQLMKDALEDLLLYFSASDALLIYIIALLRTCRPGITDGELKREYEKSILSDLYPEVPLSKNTVSAFLENLGTHYGRLKEYMRHRMDSVKADDELIVDGTLKTNDSIKNSLSDWSRKARLKNRQDISLLYAYNYDSKEPVCSQCFPGNMIDSVAGVHFLEENNIQKGILVTDKGFSLKPVRQYLLDKPDLHYLIPLKRGSKKVEQYDLFNFEGSLKNYEGVLYRKVQLSEQQILEENKKEKDNTGIIRPRFYYAYLDPFINYREVSGWIARESADPQDTTDDFYRRFLEKRESSGTIVFESDLDLSPEEAYEIFDSRWQIELCMRYYKTFAELDTVREHDDWSVIGSEFINFFSCLLAVRIENRIRESELQNESAKKVMKTLRRAKKLYVNGTWQLACLGAKEMEVLQELGLLEKPQPKKRGRPSSKSNGQQTDKPKRKPGRPRKEKVETGPKRGRGRPRKQTDPEKEAKPKRKPGRPPKQRDPNEPKKPKRPRGRPRKNPLQDIKDL